MWSGRALYNEYGARAVAHISVPLATLCWFTILFALHQKQTIARQNLPIKDGASGGLQLHTDVVCVVVVIAANRLLSGAHFERTFVAHHCDHAIS